MFSRLRFVVSFLSDRSFLSSTLARERERESVATGVAEKILQSQPAHNVNGFSKLQIFHWSQIHSFLFLLVPASITAIELGWWLRLWSPPPPPSRNLFSLSLSLSLSRARASIFLAKGSLIALAVCACVCVCVCVVGCVPFYTCLSDSL